MSRPTIDRVESRMLDRAGVTETPWVVLTLSEQVDWSFAHTFGEPYEGSDGSFESLYSGGDDTDEPPCRAATHGDRNSRCTCERDRS